MVTRLNDEQLARNERGIAACRAVVDQALARRDQPEPEKPLSRSDELLAAARRQAALARQKPAIRRSPR